MSLSRPSHAPPDRSVVRVSEPSGPSREGDDRAGASEGDLHESDRARQPARRALSDGGASSFRGRFRGRVTTRVTTGAFHRFPLAANGLVIGWARLGSNQRPPACEAGATAITRDDRRARTRSTMRVSGLLKPAKPHDCVSRFRDVWATSGPRACRRTVRPTRINGLGDG